MTKQRVLKIQDSLKHGEAVLIANPSNRFYLTGFPSSAGYVVITAYKAMFFTDSRYFEKAQKTVSSMTVVLLKKWMAQLSDFLDYEGVNRLFLETEHTPFSQFIHYRKELKNIKIQEDNTLDTLLCEMRCVKDKNELESIKNAQRITDAAFSYILERLHPGKSEIEIALELEFFMRSNGSEGIAFDTIAVSGKNSSLPHGVPTEKRLEKGDFVTMDFGAKFGGYCSDMTRTVAIGQISDEQKKVYETVLSAQKSGIEAMKAGIKGRDADRAARSVIENAGYGKFFGHSLGHSVGIDIHESPNASPGCETAFKAGTIMTVEPGIYIPDSFGVRIEDMVYITENGCENLTKSPKKLIVI
ncbi:MAG: aminopeptidase P family protein [Ruminococcaceae bacterium]|nr:aminopeptidase P family protein [Oscillospiraceae bacterium]